MLAESKNYQKIIYPKIIIWLFDLQVLLVSETSYRTETVDRVDHCDLCENRACTYIFARKYFTKNFSQKRQTDALINFKSSALLYYVQDLSETKLK
jgi:hypothetical protein